VLTKTDPLLMGIVN